MDLPTSVQIRIAERRVNDVNALGVPDLAQFEAEIDYFRRNIGDVQSDADLISDRRLLSFALAAFDLPDDRNTPALIRNVLSGSPNDPSALVNQLENRRYREFADLFQFPGSGRVAVRSEEVVDTVIQRFRDVKTAESRLEALTDPDETRGFISARRHREIDYFLQNIGNVQSAEDLVGDYRLYQFVITAFDLQGQENAQGLISRLISEDFDDDGALFNRLQNTQFREFATFFQMPGAGERNIQDKRQLMAVVERYTQVSQEIEQGEVNPGVRLALYFERNAEDVQSYFGLLADRPLREFVFQAFRLPPAMNQLPADRLAARLEELVDLEELRSPEGREALLRRFSVSYDADNTALGSGAGAILTLFRPIGVSGASAASLFAAATQR